MLDPSHLPACRYDRILYLRQEKKKKLRKTDSPNCQIVGVKVQTHQLIHTRTTERTCVYVCTTTAQQQQRAILHHELGKRTAGAALKSRTAIHRHSRLREQITSRWRPRWVQMYKCTGIKRERVVPYLLPADYCSITSASMRLSILLSSKPRPIGLLSHSSSITASARCSPSLLPPLFSR